MKNRLIYVSFCIFCISGCSKDNWDIEKNGIPEFIETNYIELETISKISKFRSSEGHDYSDDFENCCSMKHYFVPKSEVDWSKIKIYAPVNGSIKKVTQEWAGTQLEIVPEGYSAFRIVIFHIKMSRQFVAGDKVDEGEQIGTHIGSATYSDIAVIVKESNKKMRLLSFFDVMTDKLFLEFSNHGLTSRNDYIISKEFRDANPLVCNGETFTKSDSFNHWIYLY